MTECPAPTVKSGRDEKGRFAPGNSGNPAGRAPAMLPELRQRLETAAPQIIQSVIDAAQDGDMQAARLVLERIAPVTRATAPVITIPAVDQADGLAAKAEAVVGAVARGECPADIGATLIQALAGCSRIVEIDDLQRRIEALEAAQ